MKLGVWNSTPFFIWDNPVLPKMWYIPIFGQGIKSYPSTYIMVKLLTTSVQVISADRWISKTPLLNRYNPFDSQVLLDEAVSSLSKATEYVTQGTRWSVICLTVLPGVPHYGLPLCVTTPLGYTHIGINMLQHQLSEF